MKLVGRGGTLVVPLCQSCHNCQGAGIELKETPYMVDRGGSVLDLRGMENACYGQERLQELSGMEADALRFMLQLYGLGSEVDPSPASVEVMIKKLYDLEVAWGLA